ncbi:hypothetical protein [Marinilactibacillus psychrotolerans]|uniref:hypothetical protein n=1 Tax=Marinilactibacillus psychrotolerans TaxID=191770 RepID=UPI0039AF1C11
MEANITFGRLEINKKLALTGTLLIVLILAAVYLGSNPIWNAKVTAILQQIGIVNPPSWLVWSILGLGAVSAVVGVLSGFGIATIPIWAAKALAVADSFAA